MAYSPKHKFDPNNQAQAQAQLQGQAQGQLQGQAQGQTAYQALYDSSHNNNDNDNKNLNANGNLNGNANLNFNDNKNDNKVNNDVDNKVDNKVENTVDNKVNVDVDVKVDLDLKADGLSSPVIDLGHLYAEDSLIMPQVVNQTLNGGGNEFNIDQVNNLYDNDYVSNPTVTFNGGGGGGEDLKSWDGHGSSGFSMDAKAEGGESKIFGGDTGNIAGQQASGITSHADATITQDAFTQTLTLGANIQFNSITMSVAGHDLTDDHHTG
jgi:hypothetical protein